MEKRSFYSKPRHVTPQIDRLEKKCKGLNTHCSEGFNTHLWGFSGDRWKKTFILRVNLGM